MSTTVSYLGNYQLYRTPGSSDSRVRKKPTGRTRYNLAVSYGTNKQGSALHSHLTKYGFCGHNQFLDILSSDITRQTETHEYHNHPEYVSIDIKYPDLFIIPSKSYGIFKPDPVRL